MIIKRSLSPCPLSFQTPLHFLERLPTVDFSSAATISIDCNLHIKPGQNHPNLRYPDKRTTTNSSKTKFLLHCEKKSHVAFVKGEFHVTQIRLEALQNDLCKG